MGTNVKITEQFESIIQKGLYIIQMFTVKRLIIGYDLFEFKNFAKSSRRQIKISQSLDIPVLEIAKLILCQIVIFEKPPNIIAAKYSRFTVYTSYCQYLLFQRRTFINVTRILFNIMQGWIHLPFVVHWGSYTRL